MQKEELGRRKTTGPARITVNDANLNTVRIQGSAGHCCQFITTAPLPNLTAMNYAASGQGTGPDVIIARQADKNKRQIMEDEIESAEANIDYYENKPRSLDQDCQFYPFADREEFKKESEEKLQRLIDGERYFIYLTNQKLR